MCLSCVKKPLIHTYFVLSGHVFKLKPRENAETSNYNKVELSLRITDLIQTFHQYLLRTDVIQIDHVRINRYKMTRNAIYLAKI